MTEEQLTSLENWIDSIIDEKNPASGLQEHVRQLQLKDEVRRAFGLRMKVEV